MTSTVSRLKPHRAGLGWTGQKGENKATYKCNTFVGTSATVLGRTFWTIFDFHCGKMTRVCSAVISAKGGYFDESKIWIKFCSTKRFHDFFFIGNSLFVICFNFRVRWNMKLLKFQKKTGKMGVFLNFWTSCILFLRSKAKGSRSQNHHFSSYQVEIWAAFVYWVTDLVHQKSDR